MTDNGTPIAYSALAKGVPVVSRSGRQFGTVDRVLEIPEEDIFRGIVVATRGGKRFLNREQVGQITTMRVSCALTDEQIRTLPAPTDEDLYERRGEHPAFAPGAVAIVRCSGGALFQTMWIPLVSFKAIRLGSRRLQRCPVHGRWELVQRVDPSTLTEQELAEAARHPARKLP